jgi:catechol 2,3-dioxygenase-like lactoylglutathione lyase family enzyme
MTKLTTIRRGMGDPTNGAAFYAWLLGIEPVEQDAEFHFACANGSLVIHGDASAPVSVELAECDVPYRGVDPDGVPVNTVAHDHDVADASIGLDHVRLNCADLNGAVGFYQQFGFELTWSGRGEEELDGPQDQPLDGATWLHLSCDDGYLSLSQADWKDYGRRSTASGPPRFIHIGLVVASLADISNRLDRTATHYLRGRPPMGTNVYLNDPEGTGELGTNVELIEYGADPRRSGTLLRHA